MINVQTWAGGDSEYGKVCQQDKTQVTETATGASSSSNRSEQRINSQANTDGEQLIRKYDDPAKKSSLEARRSATFHRLALNSMRVIC